MNNNALISVIIPVFNVQPYLCEALDSVVHQTYGNLEIIVVDDGSTDGSGEICDRYAGVDPRISVLHQENRGLSSARNAALERASGQAVAFLDPDDAFLPDAIERMAEKMAELRADIVVCGFSVHTSQERMMPKRTAESAMPCRVLDQNQALVEIAQLRIDSAVWNKLYDRAIWKDLRFPEGLFFEGTYCLVDIFERAARVAIMDDPLVMHRARPGSICHTLSLKHIVDRACARDHFIACVERHVPTAISRSQLQGLAQRRIRGLAVSYAKYVREYPGDSKGQQLVRDLLVEAADRTGLGHCSFLTVAGYRLALTAPRSFMLLYGIYKRSVPR